MRAAVCDFSPKAECVYPLSLVKTNVAVCAGGVEVRMTDASETLVWLRLLRFSQLYRGRKRKQEKGIGAFRANAYSQQPAVRAAARVCGFWKLTLFSRFPERFDAKFEKSRRKATCHNGLRRRFDRKSVRFIPLQSAEVSVAAQILLRHRQRTTATFFLYFLAVFGDFLSILIPFLTSCDPHPPCVPHLSVAFYVVKSKASPEQSRRGFVVFSESRFSTR